jgi:hypothetical protein
VENPAAQARVTGPRAATREAQDAMDDTLTTPRTTIRRGPPFAVLALRLVGCLLLELVAGLVHMVVFLFRRGSERRRMHSVILRRSARAAALLLVSIILSLSGCAACREERISSHPGTSIEFQLNSFADSFDDIFRMRDWKESLLSDLDDLTSDPPCMLAETLKLWGW